MVDGKTIHAKFRLPWNVKGARCAIDRKHPEAYENIKKSQVILWDQAALCSKYVFEEVDRFLRQMMGSTQVFGGKLVVVCGDFRECLPIVKKCKQPEGQSILNSKIWPQLQQFVLKDSERFKTIDDFSFCLNVGKGTWNEIFLPNSCRVYNLNTLVNTVYGFDYKKSTTQNLMDRSILTLRNQDVDYVNDECLKALYRQHYVYNGINYFRKTDPNKRSQHYFMDNLQLPKYFPPADLRLNKHCPIILCQAYKGLPQGTRLVVKDLLRNTIVCEIGCGRRKGKLINIQRVESKLPLRGNVELVRRQFPILLAFSMTINKAQGLQFQRMGAYLPNPAFSHGQMYVLLSRVRNIENDLRVFVKEPNLNFDHMPNIVNETMAKHAQLLDSS